MMCHLRILFALLIAHIVVSQAEAVTKCGVTSDLTFSNWYGTVNNPNAPVVFPKSEAEARGFLLLAIKNKCRVRVRGSGQSANGMVVQSKENNVLIMHLSNLTYPVNGEWADKLDVASSTATIGAGRTLFDLISMIRPEGYLLNQNTGGPFLNIGGVLANNVLGPAWRSGYFYEHVVRLRVLLSNGKLMSIQGTKNLAGFLGNRGLTGIILAAKIKVRKDTGMKSVQITQDFLPTESLNFINFQAQLLATYDEMSCFASVFLQENAANPGNLPKLRVLCNAAERSGGTPFPPPTDIANFAPLNGALKAIYAAKKQMFFANSSYDGAQSLLTPERQALLCGAINCTDPVELGYALHEFIFLFLNTSMQVESNITAGGTNDGFIVTGAVPGTFAGYNIPVDTLTKFGQAMGTVFGIAFDTYGALANIAAAPHLLNAPLEWRFFTPKGRSMFEQTNPGKLHLHLDFIDVSLASQLFSFTFSKPNPFGTFMFQIEQALKPLGATPHAGKAHSANSTGLFFTTEYDKFIAKQRILLTGVCKKADKDGVLRAGSPIQYVFPATFIPFN